MRRRTKYNQIEPLILSLRITEPGEISFPFRFTGFIHYGDGEKELCRQANPQHVYEAGEYNVLIYANSILLGNMSDSVFASYALSLVSIDQWGGGNIDVRPYGFYNCSSLESLPDNEGNVVVAGTETFRGCSSLKFIPENLFQYNTKALRFRYTFQECDSLEYIPEKLFQYNLEVTHFNSVFSNCKSISSIPENLFRYNIKAEDFSYAFYRCSGLVSIPENIFKYNQEVVDFKRVFSDCTALEYLPENLFKYNPKVVDFTRTFTSCTSLLSIPENLFRYNPKVTSFNQIFTYCFLLTSIPTELFRYNPNVEDFAYAFGRCTEISSLTPKDEDGGELWERAGKKGYPVEIDGTDCFRYCTKLENYDSIPDEWKDHESIIE